MPSSTLEKELNDQCIFNGFVQLSSSQSWLASDLLACVVRVIIYFMVLCLYFYFFSTTIDFKVEN